MDQRSPEWFSVRLGRFTGSRFAALMSTGKERENLIRDVAWERFTAKPVETYTNAAMQRGVELEPEARDWYSFARDVRVHEFAFIVHPVHDFVGVSPDGLVGDDGLLEIKCPGHRAHLETLERRKVPSQYRWQVQGQLWVTGRRWLDFLSYHPDHEGVIVRVGPDPRAFEQLESACLAANAEVEQLVQLLGRKEAA